MQGKEAPSQYKGSDLNIEEIKLVPAASAAAVVDVWTVLCLLPMRRTSGGRGLRRRRFL
jgi:hypothetical protein